MQKILIRGNPGQFEPVDLSSVIDLMAESAEPQMRLAWQALEMLFFRPESGSPALTLIRPDNGHGCGGHPVGAFTECAHLPPGRVCFVNSLVRLEGDRTLVWRILRYRADDCETWEMRWPD